MPLPGKPDEIAREYPPCCGVMPLQSVSCGGHTQGRGQFTLMAPERFGETEFGHIEIGDTPPPPGSWAGKLHGLKWRPNRRKLRRLPDDFGTSFLLFESAGGRFLRPVGPLTQFVETAFVGGLALLDATQRFDQPMRQSYRLMSLLFRWSFSARRLHARQIKRLEDLELTAGERRAVGRSVLPEDLMIERQGRRRPLSPRELIEEGQSFSNELGQRTASVARWIDYGLFSVAMQSPQSSRLTTADAECCLRYALFGCDVGNPVKDPAVIELVEGRLVELFQKHLDDPNERFNSWMKDLSTIVRTIRKQRGLENIELGEVRYVLFDLLWRSHQYASQCVAAQMMAICRCFTPEFDVDERRDFDLWFLRTPWLGGLSSIAVHGQIQLIATTLSVLGDRPEAGDRPWQACLQALLWKNQVVDARRAADRSKKNKLIGRQLAERFN